MASLIEELIDVLDKENTEYEGLFALSTEKTAYIAGNELEKLQELLEREQAAVGRVNILEKKRTEVSKDIADVLNVPEKELTVRKLIDMLKGQKDEQESLQAVYSKLKRTLEKVARVNDSNQKLLTESLDMIQFEINLAQSMRMSPETANYNKDMYNNSGSYGTGGFDAKQ